MEFEIPEDITALDRAALDKAIADALAAAASYDEIADADFTAEQIGELKAIADFIAAAQGRVAEFDAEAEKRAADVAAARAAIKGAKPAEEGEPKEEPAEEPKEEPAGAPAEEPKEEAKEEALVASAPAKRRVGLPARAASSAPKADPPANTKGVAVITAAADALGLATGQNLADLSEVAKAASKRFQAMPRVRVGGERFDRYGVANINLGRTDGLTDANREYAGDIQRLIRDAADESRLPGGVLTAAAGWCAPSETLYDLCPGLESGDGIWDVPSIGITRGGINFTKGPNIADVFSHEGFFHFTEAQVEAGVTKPCFEVPCPDFEEVRLDARGVCIKAGILQQVGYPEIIRRYIELTLVAQQHQTAAWLLQQAQGLSALTTAADVFENTSSIFTALELFILGERERLRMSFNQTLEVVAPHWLRAAVRADYANQAGIGTDVVTDAIIDAHFAARGARIQYVYNFQPLPRTAEGNVIAYPSTVELLVYPAGTFVKGTTDVISLEAVYDSTNLASNEYTALFAEEGVFLANTCYDATRLVVPLHVTGRTGASNISADYGVAAAV